MKKIVLIQFFLFVASSMFMSIDVSAVFLGDRELKVVECFDGICVTGFHVQNCSNNIDDIVFVGLDTTIRMVEEDFYAEDLEHKILSDGIYCIEYSKGVWNDWESEVKIMNITGKNEVVNSIEVAFEIVELNSIKKQKVDKIIEKIYGLKQYFVITFTLLTVIGLYGAMQAHRYKRKILRNILVVIVLAFVVVIIIFVTGQPCALFRNCYESCLD